MTDRAAANRIAVFVSPHGYGHAARACAVIEALATSTAWPEFDIYTTVPKWFFTESLTAPFTYRNCDCDVGMVQHTLLREDVEATATRLSSFLPLTGEHVEQLAEDVVTRGCRAVVCDISPLGIVVASRAGLPSILIENFTWDWIYRAYASESRTLAHHALGLRETFAKATLHIQTTPVCRVAPDAMRVPPVARTVRQPGRQVREQLGIEEGRRMVLVSMGGIGWDFGALETLRRSPACVVVPGAADRVERTGSLIRLPHHSGFYHPDLVSASDAVVAKLGYSTVAEVYAAGVPVAYVPRPRFPESPVLEKFVARTLPSIRLGPTAFEDGSWTDAVEALLGMPHGERRESAGATAVARIIDARIFASLSDRGADETTQRSPRSPRGEE